MSTPQTLTVAFCVSEGVTLSDFITPLEVLAAINNADHPVFGAQMGDVPYRIKVEILSTTMDPVVSVSLVAPTFNPTGTYAAALASDKQYDIIWVPAGPIQDLETGADKNPPEEIEFIRKQAPGAKYMISVCAGAVQLALAGVLEGKRATTNKALYRLLTEKTVMSRNIQWVPKARWVVDGNVWTSSGVTAGIDMAVAFVEHLVGPKAALLTRGFMEIVEVKESEDPFAEVFGLV